jgi:hypothetical protein
MSPIGRIAMGYDDPAEAEPDVEGRRQLAVEGVSLVTDATYADQFPANDWPRWLFQPLNQRDAIYSWCGGS